MVSVVGALESVLAQLALAIVQMPWLTEGRYAHTPEERVSIEKLIQSPEGHYSVVYKLFGIREG